MVDAVLEAGKLPILIWIITDVQIMGMLEVDILVMLADRVDAGVNG